MEDDDLTILPIKPNEETHKLKKQVHPYLPDINRVHWLYLYHLLGQVNPP